MWKSFDCCPHPVQIAFDSAHASWPPLSDGSPTPSHNPTHPTTARYNNLSCSVSAWNFFLFPCYCCPVASLLQDDTLIHTGARASWPQKRKHNNSSGKGAPQGAQLESLCPARRGEPHKNAVRGYPPTAAKGKNKKHTLLCPGAPFCLLYLPPFCAPGRGVLEMRAWLVVVSERFEYYFKTMRNINLRLVFRRYTSRYYFID